jgi:hypothetical protein
MWTRAGKKFCFINRLLGTKLDVRNVVEFKAKIFVSLVDGDPI